MTEQQIQKKIITMLEETYDAYVVKVISTSKSGVPDLLVCIEGRFIGIEVKRPETMSNISKLQEYNLDLIAQRGGVSIVASTNEQVIEGLREEGF